MNRRIRTVALVIAVIALLAAGFWMPQAVETVMERRADTVQTVRTKEVTLGGLLSPQELISIMNGSFTRGAGDNESQYMDEGSIAVYQVSTGNRYTEETACEQARTEVLHLLKAAGLTDTEALLDQGDSGTHTPDSQRRQQELSAGKYDPYENDYVGGAVCNYIVVPTYPSPKTAMLWMCDLYFETMGEEITAVLDDATGGLLAVQLRVVDKLPSREELQTIADRFMEAFAADLGLKATLEGSEIAPEDANWSILDGGYWVSVYRLEDESGNSTACTLSWVIDGTDAILLQINV